MGSYPTTLPSFHSSLFPIFSIFSSFSVSPSSYAFLPAVILSSAFFYLLNHAFPPFFHFSISFSFSFLIPFPPFPFLHLLSSLLPILLLSSFLSSLSSSFILCFPLLPFLLISLLSFFPFPPLSFPPL